MMRYVSNGRCLPWVCAALFSAAGWGQSFSFPGFSPGPEIALNGSAAFAGSSVRLTGGGSQTGSLFVTRMFPVLNGFDTTVTFRLLFPPGAILGEGFAFVIHGDPADATIVGGAGSGLGYGVGTNAHPGITNSLAVEVDTRVNATLGDTGNREISVHTRGALGNSEDEAFSLGRFLAATGFGTTQIRTLRVQYVPGTLNVYLDGAATPQLSLTYHLSGGGTYASGAAAQGLGLTTGLAYVGFTAATGPGIVESVDIQTWSWTSSPTIEVSASQPGGPGTPVFIQNANLIPGNEYFNIFSLDLCPNGPGTGPSATLGGCLLTAANFQFVADQLILPVGAVPFHFIAGSPTVSAGPFLVGPMTVDAVCIDMTGNVLGSVSQVVRLVAQ